MKRGATRQPAPPRRTPASGKAAPRPSPNKNATQAAASPQRAASKTNAQRVGGGKPKPVPTLPQALPLVVAVDMALEEATARGNLLAEEGSHRSLLFANSVKIFLERERNTELATMTRVALAGKELMMDEQAEGFEDITKLWKIEMAIIAGRISAESIGHAILELNDAETVERRRLLYLEEKTFKDVLAVEAHIRASPSGDAHDAADGNRPATCGGVRLTDGCPFVNPKDCPFHRHAWIDDRSLKDQHHHRKCKRLKFPFRLEELEYDRILEVRIEKSRNVNLRMYQNRVLNGIATGQVL